MDGLQITQAGILSMVDELLKELAQVLEFSALSAKKQQDDTATKKIAQSAGDIPHLLEKGKQMAEAGEYWLAHRLIKEALEETRRKKSQIEIRQLVATSSEVTASRARERTEREQFWTNEYERILFYALWSSIQCAYYLRGNAGIHLLDLCQKNIISYLKPPEGQAPNEGRRKMQTRKDKNKTGRLNNADSSKNYIRGGYLRFLLGMTYGLRTSPNQNELPDYSSTEKAIEEFDNARARFSQRELQPSDENLNKWVVGCIDAIEDRRIRVAQMQGFFFGTSWSGQSTKRKGRKDV